MTSHRIAEWVREEHATVAKLTDALRAQVAAIPRASIERWISEICKSFDHYRAHLTRHMSLEESEGYLTAVIEQRPTLTAEVERLKHEHAELGVIMDSIHNALYALKPDDRLLVRDVCRRIDRVLSYVDHHEDDENLLVTFVFCTDIGTKD